MRIQTDRRAVTRRSLVIALGVAALAASGAGPALAQNRDRDRDRTGECDLTQEDCLKQQLQARDRNRLRECDPARQDCQALRRELQAQVEEQWRRGRGRGNR